MIEKAAKTDPSELHSTDEDRWKEQSSDTKAI